MKKEKLRKDGIGATKVNGKTIYSEGEKPLSEKVFWVEQGRSKGHSINNSTKANNRFRESYKSYKRFYYKDVAEHVNKSKARRKNQLRIHWFWLKNKPYREVVLFLNAIDNKIMGEFK